MELVSPTDGATSSAARPSTSATCIAATARVPPMSGEPSTRLTVPSPRTLTMALAGPAPLNQKPPATPRPTFLPSASGDRSMGEFQWSCSRSACNVSSQPMLPNWGPVTRRSPCLAPFSVRKSSLSIPIFSQISSTTVSTAKQAAGEPGAR